MSAARPLYATTPRIHRGSDLRSLLRILTVLAMIGALLVVAPIAAQADPLPFDGWVYNATTGHYYKHLDDQMYSFGQAEAIASQYGGHIVTINDAGEEAWLCANMNTPNFGIGYNDVASEGDFVWVSGETPGYTNWTAGEPNDANDGEDYAFLYDCPSPQWNDVPSPDHYVIEIPGGPAPVAEITAMTGSVTVDGEAAVAGDLIRMGSMVATGAGSALDLRSGTDQLEATHEIGGGSQGTVSDNLTLSDFTGMIRTLVDNAGSDIYEIRTPISIIGVRGTDTTTTASASASTTGVDVGEVDVSTIDMSETVTVHANYSVDVDASGVGDPYLTSGSLHSCDEAGLDEAIAFGGGPHTFDCADPATIVTTSTKTISADVILDGTGALTVSGDGTHGVFAVEAGVTLELRYITITDGDATTGIGGAMYAEGDIILDATTISNSNATQGGGIYAAAGLTILNGSSVEGNTATDDGGGIYAAANGALDIQDSWVAYNTASGLGGGVFIERGHGAASILRTAVVSNHANAGGGGIALDSVPDEVATLRVENSLIDGNTADWTGGGIWSYPYSVLTVVDTTVANNHSRGLGWRYRFKRKLDDRRFYLRRQHRRQ